MDYFSTKIYPHTILLTGFTGFKALLYSESRVCFFLQKMLKYRVFRGKIYTRPRMYLYGMISKEPRVIIFLKNSNL